MESKYRLNQHNQDIITTQSRHNQESKTDGPPVAHLGERCQRTNVDIPGETLSQCHLSVCPHKLSAVANIPSRLVHGVVAISFIHESDTVAISTCQNRMLEASMAHETDGPMLL